MDNSTPQDHETADEYAELIKPGDAVETPDGSLWVVESLSGDDVTLTSAFIDDVGDVYVDRYEPTKTIVPRNYTRKVADARRVRRP
jgi:hypothetical protein